MAEPSLDDVKDPAKMQIYSPEGSDTTGFGSMTEEAWNNLGWGLLLLLAAWFLWAIAHG